MATMQKHTEKRPLTRWFAAHIVMMVKLKDQKQDHFPVWENIILIEAATEAECI